MANPTLVTRRRWYDQQAELSRCVGLLAAFPPEVQNIVADGMIDLAEREFEVHTLLKSLKSLGPETVLGIYKSKNKRRQLDQAPHMHQALNYFYILSAENRLFLAQLTIDLVSYIYRYFEACRQYREDSSADHLLVLTRKYVQNGGPEAQKFLDGLQKQFSESIRSKPRSATTPALSDHESGMRLKKLP